MRRLWSLVKFLIFLAIILAAGGAALFWLPIGRSVILPVARYAGNYFLNPMKLEIRDIDGSIHDGLAISDLRIISGDENLLSLDYASVSPDWDLVLDGVQNEILGGLPFVKNLEIGGVKSSLEKVMTIANHFATSDDESPDEDEDEAFDINSIKLNPFNLKIRDIDFASEFANVNLHEFSLNESGNILLNTDIISDEKVLPVKIKALMDFSPLKISSSDLRLGEKISAQVLGNLLPPFDLRAEFAVLGLDDIWRFVPKPEIDFSGKIYGRVFVKSVKDFATQEDLITASGVLSVPNGKVMDIPFNLRVPFDWDGRKVFGLTDATLKTKAANVNLTSKLDTQDLRLNAAGRAENISLREIGRIAAPDAKLEGENGFVDFNVKTVLEGDILSNTDGSFYAEIPGISAAGLKILKGFKANAKLKPGQAPKLALNGEIFGGKLFARGEATQDSQGNFKPQAVVSIVNLDLPTVIKTFPELAKSVTKPAGKITARTVIADDLSVSAKITSGKLSANGFTLNDILAELLYNHQRGQAILEKFRANFGKSLITANASANLNTSDFRANANVNNFEPRTIRELRDVSGIYDLEASASGKYDKIQTIKANARLLGKNAGYAGTRIGDLEIPVSFANNILNIANSRISLPGGNVNFHGNVNISNTANPHLDIAASTSTSGINLARLLTAMKLQDKNMPVSGQVRGNVNVKGNLSNASVNASVKSENVHVGNLVNSPYVILEANGNMQRINITNLDAKINDAKITGNGKVNINQRNFDKSNLDFTVDFKNLELKPILKAAMGSSPVTGNLNGKVKLKGSVANPELNLDVNSPIYANAMKIQDISVKLKSPSQNRFDINAAARIDEFRLDANVDLREKNSVWYYTVNTKPLNIDKAIKTQMPDMGGLVNGNLTVKVDGSTKANAPINVNVNSRKISLIDKIDVNDIAIPVIYSTAKNTITIKNGSANISNGIINSNVDVDLNKSTWKSNISVRHLDFGKLVTKFLPEGELVGSVDVDVKAKGNFGVMPTNFADGKFHTGPGYLHKMSIINKISPTKKISFEKILGTFFWNGQDLFLNPGTQATADRNEPLYRYFSVNGSLGIPGKGLRLLCDGRFDLKILDQLLGAMKGVFQLMTGGLTGNALRDAAGKVLGVKKRDFQNVRFTLANSWDKLQLLNLQITKSLEEFLPINVLNKDSEEQQKNDTQFKMRLNIPVGQGVNGSEETSTSDQFKEQLIDNLFNFGF